MLIYLFRENRYLLLLTENYSALRLLQQADLLDHDPLVLFGSSFPHDINYTQVKDILLQFHLSKFVLLTIFRYAEVSIK